MYSLYTSTKGNGIDFTGSRLFTCKGIVRNMDGKLLNEIFDEHEKFLEPQPQMEYDPQGAREKVKTKLKESFDP